MKGKVIIIVEDDPGIREMIQLILSEGSYNLFIFSHLYECEELTTVLAPDLFILDVNLPDGNGLEYCEKLRSAEALKNIPVLLMSASKVTGSQSSCADVFIEKPFDIYHFISSTERLLGAVA